MNKSYKHYISYKLTVILLAALTVILTACSPESSPMPSATETQGAAVKLVFTTQPVGGNAGSVFVTQPVVSAEDNNGNVVTDFSGLASIAITGGTGSSRNVFFGGTKVTSTNGVFNFKELAINKVGSYTLTATIEGLTPAVSAPFEITPSEAVKIVFSTQIAGAPAGSPFSTQPVVTLYDNYGNIATTSTAEVSLSIVYNRFNPVSTLYGTKTITAVNGTAVFTDLFIDKVATFSLMATSRGMNAATSNYFNITPGEAVKLAFSTQPITTTSGAALSVLPPAISVVVQDKYDNTVTDSTAEVSIAITPKTGTSGAILSGPTKMQPTYGAAGFIGLSIDKEGTGYTLTASSSGLAPATSEPFDIIPPAPDATSSNTTAP